MDRFSTILAISLISLSVSNSSNAESVVSPSDKLQLQQSLEKTMPATLFATSFTLAQMQYGVGTFSYLKPVNPFDPSFAKCMDNALLTKDYLPALTKSMKSYLTEVDSDQLATDINFLRSNIFVNEMNIYSDLFSLFAKNKTLKQNQGIFYSRMEQRDIDTTLWAKKSEKLDSYFFNYVEHSPLSDYVTYQITQCHRQQKSS